MPNSPEDACESIPPNRAPTPSSGGVGGLLGRYSLLFVADITSRALRFFADVVLVRHFGQTVFGQLNLAQSLAVQGIGLAGAGLDTAGMRNVASGTIPAPVTAATVVVLRLALGLIAWTIVAGLALAVPRYRDSFELAALYGLSIFTGALTLGWVAQGRGRVHVVGLAMLATHLGYFGGVQLAVFFDWPPVSVPILLIVAEALAAAGVWTWVVYTIGPVTRLLSRAGTWRFLRESLPIGGANLIRGMIVGSDILLLGLFVDKAQVGLYSAAFKLYSLGASLLAMYFTVLLPDLASRAATSRVALTTGMFKALRASLLATLPVTAAGLLLAGALLRTLFGPEFDAASLALRILIVALIATLASGQFRVTLVALGRQRQDLAIVAGGAIAHAGMKLLLIPAAGIAGAAWGTLAGEIALLALSWIAVRSAMRADPP